MPHPPLSLTCPRDLLASVPYQLGFVPADSLVVVHLDVPAGPPGRTPRGGRLTGDGPVAAPGRLAVTAVARADLPAGEDAQADVLEALTGTVAAGAPWAVAVVYEAADTGGGPPPRAALVDSLGAALAARGAVLLDAWHVGAAAYRSYRCPPGEHPGCCPPGGRPAADLRRGPVPAEAVWRGLAAAPSRREALPDLRPAAAGARREVLRAVAALPAPSAAALPAWRAASLARWRRARARYERGAPRRAVVGPAECAALLAALADVPVRDAVLVDLGAGAGQAAEAVAAGRGARAVAGALAGAPDAAVAAATVRLAHDLAVRCDGPAAAPALAVAAWASWTCGAAPAAGEYAAAALERDPRHRLALLVARAVAVGLPPRPPAGAGVPG
ncbi:hypothetical protein NUM3379_44310 [Kineococcus sp. NUM-3379]